MSESKAKETLEKAGYKYDLQYKSDSTVTKGNVISQSTSGSTVTLYISSGSGSTNSGGSNGSGSN